MSSCESKTCGTKNPQCKCKTFIKGDTCTTVIDCCGEKTGIRYCICVCKCGDDTCVSIIDCENDAPLEQELEKLQITNGEEVPCKSKCFVEGDTCVAVIDCCQDLAEKPKHCVSVVKCNGKLFKSPCGGAKQFRSKCKRSDDGSVHVDCSKEKPKKCIVVCDCENGGICVSVKDTSADGDACGKLAEGEHNCECECYMDKGICVAVLKC